MRPLRCFSMPALGEEFRNAREARGLTLSDVSEQIHIRSAYLNAIESEDWTQIGAPVYVRGFLRTYARFLGLDGESAVSRFNALAPVERPVVATTQVSEREGGGPSPWLVGGIVVALLLVAFAGYEWWQYSTGNPQTVAARPSTAPPVPGTASPAASAGPSPAESAQPSASPSVHGLAVRLTQRSWLRVTVDGRTAIEGIFPAGTERNFAGKHVLIRAGNAGGVTVSVNGAPPARLGADGDVIDSQFTL